MIEILPFEILFGIEKTTSPESTLSLWKSISEIVQAFATTLGLIIGGVWVYFNFIQQRAYRKKLEPIIVGRVECRDNVTYLSIDYELKSIGQPKTEIDAQNSGILIYKCSAIEPDEFAEHERFIGANWEKAGFAKVFDKHAWIERDETIKGSILMMIPSCDYLAFRLELTIFAGKKKQLEWNAETIVPHKLD